MFQRNSFLELLKNTMLPERWRKKPPSLWMGAWFLKVCEAFIDVGVNAAFNVGKREPEENIGLSSTVAWIANEGEGKGHSFYSSILIEYVLNELCFSLSSSKKIMRKYTVGITPALRWSNRPPRGKSSKRMCQCWAPGISGSRDQSSGWEFKRS